MPVSFHSEGEAFIKLVFENVLDVGVANLEGKIDAIALLLGEAVVEYSTGKLGLLRAETALRLVYKQVVLVKRIN